MDSHGLQTHDETVQAYVALLRRTLAELVEVTDNLRAEYAAVLSTGPLWFLYDPQEQIELAKGVLAMDTGRLAHQFWENMVAMDCEAWTLACFAHGKLYGRPRTERAHIPSAGECRAALA